MVFYLKHLIDHQLASTTDVRQQYSSMNYNHSRPKTNPRRFYL